jgi:hypothetical protein
MVGDLREGPVTHSWNCGGVGGYSFVQGFGDWQFENVIDPLGYTHYLPVGAFSTDLGPKAEWRGTLVAPGKVDPFALVYRVIVHHGEAFDHHVHSLVVVKLNTNAPCVFAMVNATDHDNANVLAREAADRARDGECAADPPQLF